MMAMVPTVPSVSDILVEARHLSVSYPTRGRKNRPWQAVRDVSLIVERGTTVGLVGESGSGKTTFGQAVLRRIDPVAGSVHFDGSDITSMKGRTLRQMRSRMQMIFQNPVGSLNPRMTVLQNIAEPLVAQGLVRNANAASEQVGPLMDRVGLRRNMMFRYPSQFSGGQSQRVGIARALAISPEFIVADEPVSSLDVSIQAQIVNLLSDLRREHGLTMLFIAHDLAVVKHIADKIATMYAGEIVEIGDPVRLYQRPLHPYSDALMSAIPVPDYPRRRTSSVRVLAGTTPDLKEPPIGCSFAARCPYAQELCRVEKPLLREIEPGRFAACHFSEDLDLKGAD